MVAGHPGQKSDLPKTLPIRFHEDFLDSLDGRSQVARTLRTRLAELHRDLGGYEALSYQERSLCRRCVFLEAVIESHEIGLALGEPMALGQWVHAVNSLLGVLRLLGLKRRVQQLPTLEAYLSTKRNGQAGGPEPASSSETLATPTLNKE